MIDDDFLKNGLLISHYPILNFCTIFNFKDRDGGGFRGSSSSAAAGGRGGGGRSGGGGGDRDRERSRH